MIAIMIGADRQERRRGEPGLHRQGPGRLRDRGLRDLGER